MHDLLSVSWHFWHYSIYWKYLRWPVFIQVLGVLPCCCRVLILYYRRLLFSRIVLGHGQIDSRLDYLRRLLAQRLLLSWYRSCRSSSSVPRWGLPTDYLLIEPACVSSILARARDLIKHDGLRVRGNRSWLVQSACGVTLCVHSKIHHDWTLNPWWLSGSHAHRYLTLDDVWTETQFFRRLLVVSLLGRDIFLFPRPFVRHEVINNLSDSIV